MAERRPHRRAREHRDRRAGLPRGDEGASQAAERIPEDHPRPRRRPKRSARSRSKGGRAASASSSRHRTAPLGGRATSTAAAGRKSARQQDCPSFISTTSDISTSPTSARPWAWLRRLRSSSQATATSGRTTTTRTRPPRGRRSSAPRWRERTRKRARRERRYPLVTPTPTRRLRAEPESGTVSQNADVAQLVEHQLPKLGVAGSSPVVRFRKAQHVASSPRSGGRADRLFFVSTSKRQQAGQQLRRAGTRSARSRPRRSGSGAEVVEDLAG